MQIQNQNLVFLIPWSGWPWYEKHLKEIRWNWLFTIQN